MKPLSLISVSFVFMIVISGCTNTTQESTKSSLNTTNEKELAFDIDLSKLSYDLPTHSLICTPEVKFNCTVKGCEKMKAGVFLLYDEDLELLYRCDKNPCDSYMVEAVPSGLYTLLRAKLFEDISVKLTDKEMLKTLNPDLEPVIEYVERIGLGTETMLSYGICK